MKFGPIDLRQAEGAYLAHAVATPEGTLRKGTRLAADEIRQIRAAGFSRVIAARLEVDDIHENEAAARIAAAVAGQSVRVEAPATGRSNLFAERAGLLEVDSEVIDAINRLDPAITLATRPPLRGVESGRMIATVKIIPFAVKRFLVEEAVRIAAARPPVQILPYRPLKVAVVSTLLPTLKKTVIEKTLKALEQRLAPAGACIAADIRVSHEETAIAKALTALGEDMDLTIMFGASAVVDAADVIPAAVTAAGGRLLHLGMPVDPGNLLMLAEYRGRPLLGAPGCARSPRENGFDFVLERILAGQRPTARDITGMGVGGLLMDIVSRPAPRSGEAAFENPDAPRIAALLLCAGRSTRFSGGNKLMAKIRGEPLVRHAARAALGAKFQEVIVVTGHQADAVAAALADLPVHLVHNPRYAEGQATSVATGIAAVTDKCEAAMVLLGDMPAVTSAILDQIIDAYSPREGSYIVVATHQGKRGNPVLWSRRYFAQMMSLEGDQGARGLLRLNVEAIAEVEAGPAVLADVDTEDALAQLEHFPVK